MNRIPATTGRSTPHNRGGGLYLHIPFCRSLCGYCHFTRTDRHDAPLRRRLVDGILAEFSLRRGHCATLRQGCRSVATVYVGGGTPSVLEPPLLQRLLQGTLGKLPAAKSVEITVEANPENFTTELADAWLAAGVNRISLGIQSFDERVLARLDRRCSPAKARRSLQLACQRFPRVAADWMVGPGVNRKVLLRELQQAVALGVEHISVYILELHPGTPLAAAVQARRVVMPAADRIEGIYLAAVAALAELGLYQYEVSNFARPGCESRHNQRYWLGYPYLGLGPGAHGYWGRRRYANLTSIAQYLAAVDQGRIPEAWHDPLPLAARRLEHILLRLRMREGIALERLPTGALDLNAGTEAGWWRLQAGRLCLTASGFLRIDSIVETLARALSAPPPRASGRTGPG